MKLTIAIVLFALATLRPGAAASSESLDVLSTLKPGHPRLFADTNGWNELRAKCREDETLRRLVAVIEHTGRELMPTPPLAYKKTGRRLLSVSRAALNRIAVWSFCYQLTGEKAFARRAEKEMIELAAFPDWNPSHFLDAAEMTAALAIGYDWLFAEIPPASRVIIRNAIVEKGLKEGVGPDARHTSWRRARSNWNQVCFGGLTLGALTIADEEPALARTLLEAAREEIIYGLSSYDPDGVYPEGPNYWNYGTVFQVFMLAALDSALGTTWQLENSPGFIPSFAAQLHLVGPTGLAYNFSDGGESSRFKAAMFWFARRMQKPEFVAAEWGRLQNAIAKADDGEGRSGILPFVALWWSGSPTSTLAPQLPLAWYGNGKNPIGVFRSSWTDTNALYLAFKGGSARHSHAHMDVGSFILESDGVRWAVELGAQNYNSIESKGWNLWDREQNGDRWKVYRLNNFSHSTLSIDGQLHRAKGDARITAFDAQTLRASMDLTEIFAPLATNVIRHFQMAKDRQVVITDDLSGLKPGTEVCWQMVTRAAVKTGRDRAVLRQDGKALSARLMVPEGAKFTVQPADPPSDGVNEPNPGVSILTLKHRAQRDGSLRIKVLLQPGDVDIAHSSP